ncbi:autotransporter outer membrane beta-barrel domain-containing protein [Salmonella enterica subsp. enterica serovar Stanley]|nr:autotransporter outer membrane beta-barrel domain-containing protein [Salmonella enterica]EBS6146523.1 autotransporter outer membrane beta-barrel domain-containing protein [Salmonella enterica subsp. enterica serovar Stanley]EED7213098.1 autotransporter outer membrane beta-barrel domain-containing protein [Salmonella enterica subsp. enterica]EBU7839729.1 hypothetical protein [Salmonella enterica subsp. enterica serovar Stanley]EEJ0188511.1 autotransporter outer membrane beta-barrel domain-co
MNRTYSIVWSAVRNMYVVASELARGHSKVKAQVCASEIHSPNQKSEYGQIIKATRAALACAVAAALGFFSPLAMADNQVSYADAQPHVLDASTPPMSYSGTDEGAALYVSGVATVGWQPTKVTGSGLVIETSGGGADDPDGGKYVSNAISLDHYAILELTDAQITTTGIYTQGISAADGSTLTLTDSTLTIDGNFGVMTLYTGSEATLNDTTVQAANGSSVQVQQGSTLNVLDGSKITLAQGQINVVAGNTATDEGSTLNLSDSSVSSAGTMSTIQGTNKAALNLTNATITHTNASGAAVQANNATTLDISGGNITSAGMGVYILASDARSDGATINADGDGIFITSKRKLDGYEDLNALTVNKAQVNSDTIALHVDTGTTINAPIVLTDSTFEAPEVIKLGSKAVIQANNTTLIGDVAQSDMSSSSLSLSQGSTLTGSVDAMFTTLSLDDTSQWNMTDPSTVGNLTNDGDITLGNASGSTGTLLTVGNTLTLQDGSQINATLDTANSSPIIKAANVTLDGTLNLSSTATFVAPETDEHFGSITLIDSQTAITTDFDSVTLDADTSAMPDYLTINAGVDANDNTNYELSTGLSWYAGAKSARAAHGTFTVDAGSTFTVTSVLGDKTGNGDWDGKSLTKLGAGKLTLSGANTYTGDTNVQEGTLWLAGDGTIGEVGSQQAVNVASDATFGGSNGTTVNGKVTNEGTLVFGDSEETGAIFTLNGDLINMGTMTSGSSSSTPGNTLYVDGDYTGNGGSLYLNTVLGDDDSATDKLVITGDASGTTDLYINGIGDGAQTTNGIEVVDVGGVSTSDAFELKNEVNAGLYTYRLYWNESDNDWYLASKAQSDDDDSGGDDTPSDGGDDGGNVTPPDDGGDGGDVAPQYRADIGAYMGNQWMARNLQMQTLYDREGSQYRNADGSVWARFKAGKAESEAVSGNIDMDSNYSQFQLGGDILAWGNGQQSVTVGVMASYINADIDSTGNRGADGSQFTSSGNVDGYNLGVYATWFADAQTHSGAYVDSWYQYGFYNNSVESGDAGSESYDSTANAVSLETGYRYDIALSNGNTVSLTPQAQVVWQNYSADSVKDNYGTRIDGQDGDSWTTRLGLRVDGKLYKGSRTVIQPFAEANWLHTSDDVSVSFDDATVKQDLPANRAELKVGLQADIDKQWSVRAQVAGQTGSNDFGDLNGSLNLRYNW